MLLMVDVAPNHMGAAGSLLDINYETYSPFNARHHYHPPNFIKDWANQTEVEQFWMGSPAAPLPDLNTELPEVYNELYEWVNQLVKNYSIDGLRLDTAKHIRKSFWPQFCKSAGVFAMGEAAYSISEMEFSSSRLRPLILVTSRRINISFLDSWTSLLTRK